MNEAYRTIQGDTWDMIAKKVYGDEKYLVLFDWPIIFRCWIILFFRQELQ